MKVYFYKIDCFHLNWDEGSDVTLLITDAHHLTSDAINDYANACTLLMCVKDCQNLMEFFIFFSVIGRDWLISMKLSTSM